MDTPPNPEELTTSTTLAAESDIDVILEACVDFWFDEWCGDFAIVDVEQITQKDALNIIAYSRRGNPRSVQWADGVASESARDAIDHLNACLRGPSIIDEPEEMASPADWVEFLGEVGATVDEHYEPCFIVEPVNSVTVTPPSFKLCDSDGRVYDAIGGLTKKTASTRVRRGQ